LFACADEELRTRGVGGAHGGFEPSKALTLCDTRAVHGESSRPVFKPREDARQGLFCLRAVWSDSNPRSGRSPRRVRTEQSASALRHTSRLRRVIPTVL